MKREDVIAAVERRCLSRALQKNNSFSAHKTPPHPLPHPVLCVSVIALPLNRLSLVISSFRDWPALQCEDQLIKARQAGESLTHEISVSLAAQQLQG